MASSCRIVWALAVWTLLGSILVGCGRPVEPSYPTPAAAVENQVQSFVTVLYEEPVGSDRILMYQRQDPQQYHITYVAGVGRDRWRWEGGTQSGPLRDIGPVSFEQCNLGHLETKNDDGVILITGKAHAIYGVAHDPRVTWVEVTHHITGLTERADVRGGAWVVHFPYESVREAAPDFSIRGGSDDMELFSIDDAYAVPKK